MHTKTKAIVVIWVSIVLFVLPIMLYAQEFPNLSIATATWNRAIYNNDSIFNQLSGAAQIRLEMQYGKKASAVSPSQIQPINISTPNSGFTSDVSELKISWIMYRLINNN